MIEKSLLFLLLLLIPSQLAFHLWPSWSHVNGLPVDYLSPTLYLTDILVIFLFSASGYRTRIPLFIISFAVLNILISSSPNISIYKWSRLLEYFWLFKYLNCRFDWKLKIENWSLGLAIIWSSFLAWSQLLKQASIGGFWYWFGERPLSLVMPGVAKIDLFPLGLFLRPYATFPHPNALAGFLLISSLILYCHSDRSRGAPWISKMTIVIAMLTIPITFSRSAIALELLIISGFVLAKIRFHKLLRFLFIALIFALYALVLPFGNPSSLSERVVLNQLAINIIKKAPLLGIGLGTSIPATFNLQPTTNNLQPVHNIYLLIASELGLPALILLSFIGIKSLGHLLLENRVLFIACLTILLTSFIDHFWLTLNQNLLLLTLFLSIVKIHARPSMTKSEHQ